MSWWRSPGKKFSTRWRVWYALLECSVPRHKCPVSANVIAASIVLASLAPVWRAAHVRRTNLDLVSTLLAERAAPGDLILLNPFWLAPGFKYHYRGTAEWSTIPLTSTDVASSVFPFAPIKRAMETPSAIVPTLERVGRTLDRGNRLWIVGHAKSLDGRLLHRRRRAHDRRDAAPRLVAVLDLPPRMTSHRGRARGSPLTPSVGP